MHNGQPKNILDYFQLETGSTATSIIITAGATASRAADNHSIATPSVLSAEQGAIRLRVSFAEAGQVNKYIGSIYIDATHFIRLFVNATQVIAEYNAGAGVTQAIYTYTHTAADTYADIYWDKALNELGVRADLVSGDINAKTFATISYSGLASLPANMYLMGENGIGVLAANMPDKMSTAYSSKGSAKW